MPRPTSLPTRCSVWEVAKENPKEKIKWCFEMLIWKIWIVLMENLWSSSVRCSKDSQHLATSNRFKNSWKNNSVIQSSSMAGSSSCQCPMTSYGEKKGNEEKCKSYFREVANCARRFPRGHWSFLGPGSEKKRDGTYCDKPDGVRGKTAEDMMLEFAQTIHPLFRASSAFERGELRSKGGKKTIHFNGSEQNVELILRTIISAIIYGGVADVCREVSKDTMCFGETWNTWFFGVDGHSYWTSLVPMNSDRWNLLQGYEQQFEQQSDNQKLSKLSSDAGLNSVERGKYFITLDAEGPSGMVHLCREYTLFRNDPRTRARGWSRRNTKIDPSLERLLLSSWRSWKYWDSGPISVSRQTLLVFRFVNGVEKYVTETTETIGDEEHRALGKSIAKARPRLKSSITLTPVTVPP